MNPFKTQVAIDAILITSYTFLTNAA